MSESPALRTFGNSTVASGQPEAQKKERGFWWETEAPLKRSTKNELEK